MRAAAAVTLDTLPVGGRGVVSSVTGSDSLATRIMEMGVTPGAQIVVMGTAPMGDPIEVEIRAYRLSLRRNEARRILVIPD